MVVLLSMTLNGVFADIASIREKTIQPNLLCLIDDEETDIFYFPARIAFLDKVKVNFGFHNEEISFIEDKVLVSGFYLPNLYKKFGVGFDGYFVKNENGWGVLWDAFNGSGSSSYYTSDFCCRKSKFGLQFQYEFRRFYWHCNKSGYYFSI